MCNPVGDYSSTNSGTVFKCISAFIELFAGHAVLLEMCREIAVR